MVGHLSQVQSLGRLFEGFAALMQLPPLADRKSGWCRFGVSSLA